MAIIRFQTNISETFHLRTLDGKPVESNYGGMQYMFSAEEGTFYVSDKVGGILMQQFRTLGVQPGESVEITKTEVGRGPERRTQWIVAKSVTTGELAEPAAPASELEQQLAASIRLVEQRKQAQAAPAAVPGWAQTLTTQTKHVLDVYAELVNYASAKHGNAVKPEDIRAMMTTVFINLAKGGANANAA